MNKWLKTTVENTISTTEKQKKTQNTVRKITNEKSMPMYMKE